MNGLPGAGLPSFVIRITFPKLEFSCCACGLVTVVIKAESRQQIVTFCESLRHILIAVSWGGHESLVMPKCASLEDDAFDPQNREHKMIRFYFGLEEPAYLIDDLENAFSSF